MRSQRLAQLVREDEMNQLNPGNAATTSGKSAGNRTPLAPLVPRLSAGGTPYRAPSEARDRETYAFVFDTVNQGASSKDNSRELRLALQRAAASIPDWDIFRRLCSADIRELWANEDPVYRNTRVQNRKNSWERLYSRFAAIHGLPAHLHFDLQGGYGIYALTYSDAKNTEETDWRRFVSAGKVVGYPIATLNAWRRQVKRKADLAK